MPEQKQLSRVARWANATAVASRGLDELLDLQSEYQGWMENLPENLESSPVGEKLQAVCDLDLEGAKSTIDEATDMELPLGFGKD